MVVFSLWIMVGACNMPPATPKPADIKPIDITGLVAGRAPSYRGITPGVSTKRDVVAIWGEPNVTRVHGAFESLHYFDKQTEESFLVRDNIVQAVTSNALRKQLVREGHPATRDDLLQVLGPLEVLTPTLLGDPIFVFPEHGLAISSLVCQLFDPAGQPEYQTLWGWGKLPLEYDPFPLIPSVEAVRITPGQTTRSQVAQLLGNPDYIVYQDRGVPWWYYVEPDMLGRLHIFFDPDDKVSSMDISPSRHTPQPLRLGDVVKQYGAPDMLQLLPSLEGSKYASQGLLYLARGLRVATRCPTPACNTVKRDAIVNQKWYYPPQKTLAEYQAWFHSRNPVEESSYIEWPGFDE